MAELRKPAHDCNYRVTLDQRPWNRLVCGIKDDYKKWIQRMLLSQPNLTFKKAMKIGLAM